MKQNYKLTTRTILVLGCILIAFNSRAQTIQLGSGSQSQGNSTTPVNGFYNHVRYQTVYTAAEINAQGVFGISNITSIAYNVIDSPSAGLPNYLIRMANTAATNCATHVADSLTTVSYSTLRTFTRNSWNTINFTTPFLWDGVSNVLVDVNFGSVPLQAPYGSLYTYSATNGSRYFRCDEPSCLGSQANAITSSTQNFKPQVRMNFVAAGSCVGTPDAGIASAPDSICWGADFTLILTRDTSDLDVTLQWQSSPDGVSYADINGATTLTFQVSQSSATYYRAIATCTNSGLSDTSNAVFVKMTPFALCYCASEAHQVDDSKIDSVQFLTVATGSLPSTCETYTDYTSLVAIAQKTVPFNLRIRNGSCSGNTYEAYVGVYIDLNQNGRFDDAGEQVYSYGPFDTFDAIPDDSITIPNSAALGQTRMRIVLAEGFAVPASCDFLDYDFGETEDYSINIIPAPPCTDPPSAGVIAGVSSACQGDIVTLNLSNQSVGTELQWQISADGNTWSDIAGAENTSIVTAPVTDTVFYRVRATCTDSAFSNPIEITLNNFLTCYCTEGLYGSCGDHRINNVNITGTTLNNNSGCTTTINGDAYTAFPGTGTSTATLLQTVPYTFNVNTDTASKISVWIDYNHNGIFEEDEWTQVTINSQNGIATLNIPLTALLGETGMRVRSRAPGINNNNGAPDACTGFGTGETEDYIITIGAAPPCAISPVGGTVSGPSSGIAGTPYTYILTGSRGNIQWEYSTTSSTGPFLSLSNVNDDTLNVSFTGAATYWIRTFVTTPGCDPDSSTAVQVVITYPGDDVCDAILLNMGTSIPYTTTFATVQTGEPGPSWTITQTMWFKFVAPSSGRVSIQSPGFDTQLALWDAPSCSSILSGGAILLEENDDDVNWAAHGGVLYSSFIDSAVCLTPGKTYFVQLNPYLPTTDSTTIVIRDLGGIVLSVNNETDISCFGLGDGSIDMNVSGGSGNYTFLWSNGAQTEDISGLTSDIYSLTVSETGCDASVISSAIIIDEPALLAVNVDSILNVGCNGDSAGEIHISIAGGTPGYTYVWSNGSSDSTLTGAPDGSYTATVTDANGCSVVSASATITEPTPLVLSLDSVTDNICLGGSSGAVYITVSGGTPGYTYAWTGGATSEDNSGLVAGLYSVTVNDGNGCSVAPVSGLVADGTLFVTVTVDSVKDNGCAGLTQGAIYITTSGGTPGYTFDWSNGGVTEDISALAGGLYDVIVEDNLGCSASASATVVDGAGVTVTVDSVINASCAGINNGTISITASGGTPAYTFDWSNGGVTEDISGLAAGTYDVVVEDVSGCTASASATVNNNAGVSVAIASITNSACAGVSTGEIDITVSGGSPAYNFSWSNGDSTEDISGLAAGTYEVSVEDIAGCSAVLTATVSNDPAVIVTLDLVTDNTCAGLNTGAVDISVNGGTPAYTFDWSNGDSTEDVSNLAGGSYVVSVVDVAGCSATLSATVGDGIVVAVTLDSSQNVSCNGANDGSVSISVTGGTPGYIFDWSNTATTEDISGVSGGSYSVEVTDTNGCTASFGPVTIVEPSALVFAVDSTKNVKCFAGNTGAVFTTASGGTNPTSILWSNNAVTEDINNLTAATYIAVLTDANGCTASVSANVTQPASGVTASAVANPQIQGGAMGSINLTVTGGTSPYSYSWNDAVTTEDRTNLVAKNYSVTITDANGCTASVSSTVTFVTGIENTAQSFAVNLYPNPTQDKVFLELTLNETSDVAIDIFNINGQLVQQFNKRNMLTTTFEMNFANEASGVYYAKIIVGETSITRRIVVAK